MASAEAEFWELPDFSRTHMPQGVPDALRSAATQFLDEYRGQLRRFDTEYEVAPGVLACRTGGHTPGHSVVRLASGDDRLTFAGDAVFQVAFDHPSGSTARTRPRGGSPRRVRLLRELAATGGAGGHSPAVPIGLPRGVAGDAFRCVPAVWDY